MIYGAIDHKSVIGHTRLGLLFKAIDNQQMNYNWLIIEKEDFQWIWGMLLGFRKEIARSKILESPLPDIEKATFWKKPVSMQHELADIEIIAFDSTYTIFKSKSKELYDGFRRYYTKSEALEKYNKG